MTIKRMLFLLVLLGLFTACGPGKRFSTPRGNHRQTATPKNRRGNKAQQVIRYAKHYLETPYKYGGTSRRGMDCSGLVYTAFLDAIDFPLPRTSRAMAQQGHRIAKRKVRPGDLLFFKTNKNRRSINHVGLVTKVSGGTIFFIHATTHAGVIISRLDQRYWRRAFAQARRLLK